MSVQTEARPVTPQEPMTPIKPSEALRLGRLIRPTEVAGRMFLGDDAACANGAIALGLGYRGPLSTGTEHCDGDTPVYLFLVSERVPAGAILVENDTAVGRGESGDAAVLAYLEERGL